MLNITNKTQKNYQMYMFYLFSISIFQLGSSRESKMPFWHGLDTPCTTHLLYQPTADCGCLLAVTWYTASPVFTLFCCLKCSIVMSKAQDMFRIFWYNTNVFTNMNADCVLCVIIIFWHWLTYPLKNVKVKFSLTTTWNCV